MQTPRGHIEAPRGVNGDPAARGQVRNRNAGGPGHRNREAITEAFLLLGTTAAAVGFTTFMSGIGAPALAIILGMAIRTVRAPRPAARYVLRFASRTVLQAGIIVFGATFGIGRVLQTGKSSLPLMLETLAIVLGAAWVGGRAFHIEPRLRTLIGVGTAVCGASAIGAISGVIAASESEVAYAISTIFAFNVVAVLTYPAIGRLLNLSQHAFGLWAGTAVNDTSSVVAAAYTYGHTAGTVAVVTKLARTLTIIPIVLVLSALEVRRSGAERRRPHWRMIPMFLVLFLLAAAANTAGLIPTELLAHLTGVATVLITVALAAIGLSTPISDLRHAGLRPLLFGAALWAIACIASLMLQGAL